MKLLIIVLLYIFLSFIYLEKKYFNLFLLKILTSIKINKNRNKIQEKIKLVQKQIKFFYFWPYFLIKEIKDDIKENRNIITKS